MSNFVQDGSSWVGFNHQQMIDEVADQIRNPAIPTKITRWLNWTALRIWSTKVIFPFFEMTPISFEITADDIANGIPFYELIRSSITGPSRGNMQIKRLLRVWIGEATTVPVYKSDGARPLFPITASQATDEFPEWRTQRGKVTHYIWYPYGTTVIEQPPGSDNYPTRHPMIWLIKVPDTELTVWWTGYRGPNFLEDLLDMSTYPAEWHPLIMQGAIVRGLKYERSPDVTDAIAEFNLMFRDLLKTLYVRPDQPHSFYTRNSTSRPSTPMLDPEHFPRIF